MYEWLVFQSIRVWSFSSVQEMNLLLLVKEEECAKIMAVFCESSEVWQGQYSDWNFLVFNSCCVSAVFSLLLVWLLTAEWDPYVPRFFAYSQEEECLAQEQRWMYLSWVLEAQYLPCRRSNPARSCAWSFPLLNAKGGTLSHRPLCGVSNGRGWIYKRLYVFQVKFLGQIMLSKIFCYSCVCVKAGFFQGLSHHLKNSPQMSEKYFFFYASEGWRYSRCIFSMYGCESF